MTSIKVTSVKNPRWSNSDKKTIDCDIKTNTLKNEVPFTASPLDPEPHGRDVFFRCMNNEFGSIAEATSTPEALDISSVPELSDEFISINKFFEYANLENSKKSFRSVVIVWGAFLEASLIKKIKQWYQDRPEEMKLKSLNFNEVINELFKIGLINENEQKKYHAIRKVRNRAAHDWDFSIDSDDVRKNLKFLYEQDHKELFHYHDDLDFLIQSIYSGTCAILVMKLI